MPEDKLPFAARLVNDRRAVAWFFGAQRAPNLLSGVLVEATTVLPEPRQANQTVAIQQRVPGEAPEGALMPKSFLKSRDQRTFPLSASRQNKFPSAPSV